MNATILHLHTHSLAKLYPTTPLQTPAQPQHHQVRVRLGSIRSTGNSNNGSQASDESNNSLPAPSPPTITPPDILEIGSRRGSKKRRRRLQEREEAKAKREPPPTVKKWEEMSFPEKALELYMGEKGALFWLNKFAYASIFIVIGAWILFRFVGPSLNLYQLDTPPLPPTAMFKGS